MNTLYIYMCLIVMIQHVVCSSTLAKRKKNSEKQKKNHKLIITRSIEKKPDTLLRQIFCVIDDISANLPDLVT